jgi:ribosome biogenesis GTPase A
MSKDSHILKEFTLLRLAQWIRSFKFIDETIREPFNKLLYHTVHTVCSSLTSWSEFVLSLGLREEAKKLTPDELVRCAAPVKKRYRIERKSFFSPRVTYKYLFMVEVSSIYSLFQKHITSESAFEELCKALGISKKIKMVLHEYASLVKEGNYAHLSSLSQNTKVKGFTDTVTPFTEFIIREADYYKRPRNHVSMFSTMSAGKSTFVNALLGHDYLPSKNEACTAKIITISDIDYIDYCVGYAVKKGGRIFSAQVNQKILEVWNDEQEVSQIVLEGDLDRISSEQTVTVIHDTPGVNYSGNAEHKRITVQHLIASKPMVILCLLDATQMFTFDFADALDALKKCSEDGNKVKVLFIINKADSFDPKKESLKDVIATAVEYLGKHEFEHPVIIPVSARAARLFKMALLDKPEFSRKDTILFNEYWDFFSQSENDFRCFAIGVGDAFARDAQYPIERDAESAVGNYKREEIINRLFSTGIPVVEHILNTFTRGRL